MIEPTEFAPTTPAAEFALEWENFEGGFDRPSRRGHQTSIGNRLVRFTPEPFEVDSELGGAFQAYGATRGGFDQESSFEDARRRGPGVFARSRQRQSTDLGEIVICGGKPFAVLDHFIFDKSTLRNDWTRNHPAQVNAIAREIVRRAAKRKPAPSVCIVGHTDVSGRLDYNYGLGLRRAKTVKEALCKALGKHASSMTFVVNSMGETDPAHPGNRPAARASNRRVDVHLLSERVRGEGCASGGGGKKLPPEDVWQGEISRNSRDYVRWVQSSSEIW